MRKTLAGQLFSTCKISHQLSRSLFTQSCYIKRPKYLNSKLLGSNNKYHIKTNILVNGTKQLSCIHRNYNKYNKMYHDIEDEIIKNYDNDDDIKKTNNNNKDDIIVKKVLDNLNLNYLHQYREGALVLVIDMSCYIIFGIWAVFCFAISSIILLFMIMISVAIFGAWFDILFGSNKKR